MKALLMILVLLLVPHADTLAQESSESELRALLDDFLAGASRNDAAIHDRFWAEDLVYTSSAGARFGKAEIMAGLASAEPSETDAPRPTYSARDARVQVFGDSAVITFQLVAEHAGSATELFYNSGVFRLIDGRWQAVVWQATRTAD